MKRITSFIICLVFIITLSCDAFASILGSSLIDGYTVSVGPGTSFTSNIFYSDQSGVGQQTEYYITYSPGSDIEPVITHGDFLFGRKKISDETARLSNIANLTAGINADFFSLQTGVPMSNLISDGILVSKDSEGQDTLGIMPDGTAFVSYTSFSSSLTKEDGSLIDIPNINKYRQPYVPYLLTDKFSSSTEATTNGIDVVLGSVEGKMKIGEKINAIVESVTENSGAIPIPKGKLVLTVDKNAPYEYVNAVSSLRTGEKVEISFSSEDNDPRWKNVKLAMGAIGGKLLINGEINPDLEKGAAPRTAIGIKKDGTMILYTIDGRQSGHSYGVQLKTLAARMKELGCIEALNLDGGGSTSIVSLLPGDGVPSLRNKPSDGGERGVSTFFFLKNKLNPSGQLGSLTFYPLTAYVLTGAKKQFSLKASDTNYHPMSLPQSINYSIATESASSEIDSNGLFYAKDDGTVRIKAQSGNVEALMDVVCLKTPTDISLTRPDGVRLESLTLEAGSEINLTATAYGGYNILTATDSDFLWSLEGDIGTIDRDGKFTAKKNTNAKGKILVTAGDKTVNIPVTLTYEKEEIPEVIPSPKPPELPKDEAEEDEKPKDEVILNSDKKEDYPRIKIAVDDSAIIANVDTPSGTMVNKENVILKADGKKIDFSYNYSAQTLTSELPENTSKISVYAKNAKGLSGYGSYELKHKNNQSVFADAKGHWAEDVLGSMYKMGIISGEQTKNGTLFRPQKQMNRSEFAVMICNYLKLDTKEYENVSLPFEDADKIPDWAMNATKALYKLGIAKGKTNSKGKLVGEPESSITRAEAATIITRTLDGKFYTGDFSFKDAKSVPQWALDGMKTLTGIGALSGYTDGKVLPMGLLTKAEAAKLLYSIL